MGSRNEDKAKAAIDELEAALRNDTKAGNNGGSVHWLSLDLSDPRLVKETALSFLRKEERLDILGKLMRSFQKSIVPHCSPSYSIVNNAA